MLGSSQRLDLIIVGGGLSGGLLAWRLHQLRPDLTLKLVEADANIGGNHTWSCFENDLTVIERSWIAPLVRWKWTNYEVRFSKLIRVIQSPYLSVTSTVFDEVLSRDLDGAILGSAPVAEIGRQHVTLREGQQLRAHCVIDARGHYPEDHLALGYQKFLGLEVSLISPHHQARPIIMDATVSQSDGYRFVYTLPISPNTMLIEDTYYSDGNTIERDLLEKRIVAYAAARRWEIAAVRRRETGVLPIIMAGDLEGLLDMLSRGAPRIGLAAALFHPTTGYSLPDAVRMADLIAAIPGVVDLEKIRATIIGEVRRTWIERGAFRMLNRFLFKAGRPEERFRILERFYHLDDRLISDFYAGRLTVSQKARILLGKPPIAIHRALRFVSEKEMMAQFIRSRRQG